MPEPSSAATWVVTYDVADDDVRERVSALLARVGQRVQQSVFECRLEPDTVRTLTECLAGLVKPDPQANVRLYRLCEHCRKDSLGIGAVRPSRAEETAWIV